MVWARHTVILGARGTILGRSALQDSSRPGRGQQSQRQRTQRPDLHHLPRPTSIPRNVLRRRAGNRIFLPDLGNDLGATAHRHARGEAGSGTVLAFYDIHQEPPFVDRTEQEICQRCGAPTPCSAAWKRATHSPGFTGRTWPWLAGARRRGQLSSCMWKTMRNAARESNAMPNAEGCHGPAGMRICSLSDHHNLATGMSKTAPPGQRLTRAPTRDGNAAANGHTGTWPLKEQAGASFVRLGNRQARPSLSRPQKQPPPISNRTSFSFFFFPVHSQGPSHPDPIPSRHPRKKKTEKRKSQPTTMVRILPVLALVAAAAGQMNGMGMGMGATTTPATTKPAPLSEPMPMPSSTMPGMPASSSSTMDMKSSASSSSSSSMMMMSSMTTSVMDMSSGTANASAATTTMHMTAGAANAGASAGYIAALMAFGAAMLY